MPANLFNLWNPYRADDGTLTFEVTQADTFRIHRGTKLFLDAALQALCVPVDGAYTWDIISGRALYYSSDPGDDNWRDRWARMWRVQVVPVVPLPPCLNRLLAEPVDLSESDSTWDVGAQDQDCYLHTAFIIADFQKPRIEVERLASDALASAGAAATLLEPAIRDLDNGVRQVQVIMRGLDLPRNIAALDSLAEFFQSWGGVVNWNAPPRWPAGENESADADVDAWMSKLDALRKKR